ncbi:MAG: FeoA domain-containing protein [Rickettsiales bacterium]|jgi:ferrous iron transport protein A|nr:FeoA domain-containing protein [Rickettsiales bacterium]
MFDCCKNCKNRDVIAKNIRRLSDLGLDCEAMVVSVAGSDNLRVKIMEMGITSGVRLKVVKIAPMRDPLVVVVRGYELIIRRNEADVILVDQVEVIKE